MGQGPATENIYWVSSSLRKQIKLSSRWWGKTDIIFWVAQVGGALLIQLEFRTNTQRCFSCQGVCAGGASTKTRPWVGTSPWKIHWGETDMIFWVAQVGVALLIQFEFITDTQRCFSCQGVCVPGGLVRRLAPEWGRHPGKFSRTNLYLGGSSWIRITNSVWIQIQYPKMFFLSWCVCRGG